MKIMTTHKFFDDDVDYVLSCHPSVREIVFKDTGPTSVLINEEDVIALAKDFGLMVFKKESCL